ncbi:DUF4862 family protein [Cellulomonas sp. ATA003]|nr:DUF4862 family protein [Cellulomonas sp. ATA003]WNB86519.1 DUF4862 family protein [Cellulomonas sp. ATA003]
MTILVSAYPALLTPEPTDPVAVRAVYARLHDVPGIGAVELPLDADGGLPDADLVLPLIPAHWDVVLTTVPGTMARMAQDPTFGLASPDDRGGDAAVDHLQRCLSTAARIDAGLGRRAVTAIGVVSAPTRPGTTSPHESTDGSADRAATDGARAARFAERLAGVLDAGARTGIHTRTGAGGVRVLVEHCDARVPGQPPAKGSSTSPPRSTSSSRCAPRGTRRRGSS